MTHVFTLTLREIAERQLLLVGSAFMGLIVLLVPFIPGGSGGFTYLDMVDTAAFVVAALLYLGGSIMMGATVIGRDLSTGRISFFLTRPFGAAEVFTGRLLGAFLTALLAATLALIPVTLVGGGLLHLWEPNSGDDLPQMLAAPLLLLLLAHFVSVAIRSRSAWLLVDIVALGVALAALWALLLRFLPYWGLPTELFGIVMSLLALFLAIAGWAGLARGRIDPIAVHRWSSTTLWSLVAAVLVAFALWSAWVFSVTPQEVRWSKSWATEVDGNGEWIGVGSGDENGRGGIPHQFLISSKTGAWMRLDDWQSAAVSADRRVALIAKRTWLWGFSMKMGTTLQLADLTAAKPKSRDLGISLNEIAWSAPALSDDGSRLAIAESKQVSVYALPEEKLLAAIPLEKRYWETVKFLDANTVQIVASGTDETAVSRFDIGRREFVSRVSLPGNRHLLDSSGEHAVTHLGNVRIVRALWIYETKSGAKVGEIPYKSTVFGRRVAWLADGNLAVAKPEEAEPHVAIHALDGSERLRVALPGAKRIAIAGEQRAGELIVAWSDDAGAATTCKGTRKLGAIDLATGSMRELAFKGWPKAYVFREIPPAGGVSTRLFSTCDSEVVLFDAATGETRALLRAK